MSLPLAALALVCAATTAASAEAAAGPPRCGSQIATIVGTPGQDVLRGTPGPDVIAGLGGGDVIHGRGGDDVICGGDGADRLYGDGGDDRLLAGHALYRSDRGGSYYVPDRLDGGRGDDALDIGHDPVYEGPSGFSGEIRFSGARRGVVVDLATGKATGQGDDTIVARAGQTVVGTPYADVLRGSGRAEQLRGLGGPDRIDGRGGNDWLLGDQTPRVGRVEASPGSDDDVMSGGRGHDYVWGDLGADDLRGGPGRDGVAAHGLGVHHLDGGPGEDHLEALVSAEPGATLIGGSGADHLDVGLHDRAAGRRDMGMDLRDGSVTVGGAAIGTVEGFEGFALTSGSAWTFHGTDGPDELTSYVALTAWLYGGRDVVWGSPHDDTIDAGAGRDDVHGNEGRDTCVDAERTDGCEALAWSTRVSP